MKFNVLVRSTQEYGKPNGSSLAPVFRNPDPLLHPFEREREYKRALNATKLDKVFAKPFVAALAGHTDSVYSIAKHPENLRCMLSGAFDGEVRVWSLVDRSTRWSLPQAHTGVVRGVVVTQPAHRYRGPARDSFLTCGDDRAVKLWKLPFDADASEREEANVQEPLRVWHGSTAYTSIDAQPRSPLFATSGSRVDVWNMDRAEPTRTYTWGTDTVMSVRFNPVERHVLASTATDRSVALYDLRGDVPVRKLVLQGRSNSLAWNPMEPFNFTVANEDHNLYTFDMRKLKKALNVHKDHVYAVLDVDYSPTGREIVSGSYDRTIRIFSIDAGHSRAVYHTKRMQRVFGVRFTMDSRFVVSASDDANLRLWKTQASAPIRSVGFRERRALDYQEKLKQRYAHVPELARIRRHQHVPKAIYNAAQRKRAMVTSEKRKRENVIKHTAKKRRPSRVPTRKASIVTEAE